MALIPLLVTAWACAGAAPAEPGRHHRHGMMSQTSTTESLGMFPQRLGLKSRIYDLRTKQQVTLAALLADLETARVIYVGENHDNPHDHAVQAGLLRHLWRQDRSLWVGVEMVSRPFQTALDAWAQGETEEEELLETLEWEERWGFDFDFYRPVFEFARAHRLSLVALNAPAEVTRAISRGGLEALSPEQRAELPELDTKNELHRAMVEEAFQEHKMPPDRFERFYLAQLAWDETMADTVAARALAAGAPRRGFVIAGLSHLRDRLGIPSRAQRRGVSSDRVVIPALLGPEQKLKDVLEAGGGDYAWVMGEDPPASEETPASEDPRASEETPPNAQGATTGH